MEMNGKTEEQVEKSLILTNFYDNVTSYLVSIKEPSSPSGKEEEMDYHDRSHCGHLTLSDTGKDVILAGWVDVLPWNNSPAPVFSNLVAATTRTRRVSHESR